MDRALEDRYQAMPASKLRAIADSADYTQEARQLATRLLASGEHAQEEPAQDETQSTPEHKAPWTPKRIFRLIAALVFVGSGIVLLVDGYDSSRSFDWEDHLIVLGLGNALWLLGVWIGLRAGVGLLMGLHTFCLGLAFVGMGGRYMERNAEEAVLVLAALFFVGEFAWYYVVIQKERDDE